MARPITWQNIGEPAPRFDNSGFAVASEAFSSAAENSRKLAAALQKQSTDEQGRASAYATNDFVIQGLKDGKFTVDDLQNPAWNVDIGAALEAFQKQGEYTDNLDTNAATRATAAQELAVAQDALNAAPGIRADNSKLLQAQIDEAVANKSAAFSRQGLTDQSYQAIVDTQVKSANLEKTINQYDLYKTQGLQTKGDEAFAASVQTQGFTPENLTPEDQKRYVDKFIEDNINDERGMRDAFMKAGGSSTDFYIHTPEGRAFELVRTEAIKTRAANDAAKFDKNKEMQAAVQSYWGDGETGDPLALTIVNGKETFSSGNKIINPTAIEKIYNDAGIDPTENPEILTTLKANFPTPSAFKYFFDHATIDAGKGKRKFMPNANTELNTLAGDVKNYAKQLLDTQEPGYGEDLSSDDILAKAVAARKPPIEDDSETKVDDKVDDKKTTVSNEIKTALSTAQKDINTIELSDLKTPVQRDLYRKIKLAIVEGKQEESGFTQSPSGSNSGFTGGYSNAPVKVPITEENLTQSMDELQNLIQTILDRKTKISERQTKQDDLQKLFQN